MDKPHAKSTVKYMKEYIRSNELNKKAITLGLKKADMIKKLKELGHWDYKHDKPEDKPKKKEDIQIEFKKEKPKPKKKVVKKKTKKPEPKVVKKVKKKVEKTELTDEEIITLMKHIEKGKITRKRVITYEENKDDIKEVISNGIEGLEQNIDVYDRKIAKYMLRSLKRPSSDKVIKDASDEDQGDVFLDFYYKLYNEWKTKTKK